MLSNFDFKVLPPVSPACWNTLSVVLWLHKVVDDDTHVLSHQEMLVFV